MTANTTAMDHRIGRVAAGCDCISGSHELVAGALARHLQPGTRIGDAFLAAQTELARDPDAPAGPDILMGQILLGDPAQAIR